MFPFPWKKIYIPVNFRDDSYILTSRVGFGGKVLREDLSQLWESPHLSSFLIQFFLNSFWAYGKPRGKVLAYAKCQAVSARCLWSVIYIVFQSIIQYKFFSIMLLFEKNRCPVQTRLVFVEAYCWSSMSMKYFLKA